MTNSFTFLKRVQSFSPIEWICSPPHLHRRVTIIESPRLLGPPRYFHICLCSAVDIHLHGFNCFFDPHTELEHLSHRALGVKDADVFFIYERDRKVIILHCREPQNMYLYILRLDFIHHVHHEKIHRDLSMLISLLLAPLIRTALPRLVFVHRRAARKPLRLIAVHEADKRNLTNRAFKLVLELFVARDLRQEKGITRQTFPHKLAELHLGARYILF